VNIIFVLLIGWLILNIHFANKQLFYREVQENLVELEGLIAHQKDNNWPEPNLVTTKLSKVLDGMYLSLDNAKYLKIISNSDKEILEKLTSKLRLYPQDETYRFSNLTQEDKKNFELLQSKLRDAQLGLNITIYNDWKSFMSKSKVLEESIEVPLDNKD